MEASGFAIRRRCWIGWRCRGRLCPGRRVGLLRSDERVHNIAGKDRLPTSGPRANQVYLSARVVISARIRVFSFTVQRSTSHFRLPLLGTDEASAALSTDVFQSSYREHSSGVFRHLVLLGLDSAAAEDIHQETFLRLHFELKKGRGLQSPRWWLLKVTTNLALNYLRDNKSRKEFGGTTAQEILDRACSQGADAEQQVLGAERARALSRAFDHLSPQQKACVHLRAEGMRYAEIAEALGVSISTVEEYLSRAIARIRMKMK